MSFRYRSHARKFLVHILYYLIILGAESLAQQSDVPVNVQIPLLFKILSYDRALKANPENKIIIGLAYQGHNKYSRYMKEEIEEYTNANPGHIGTTQIKMLFIDLDQKDLDDFIGGKKIAVLYVAPLRAYDIGGMLSVTQKEKIITVTGVQEYVEKGISVGVGLRSDKPVILINLRSAKAEGADFSSQLLKLAKIIE